MSQVFWTPERVAYLREHAAKKWARGWLLQMAAHFGVSKGSVATVMVRVRQDPDWEGGRKRNVDSRFVNLTTAARMHGIKPGLMRSEVPARTARTRYEFRIPVDVAAKMAKRCRARLVLHKNQPWTEADMNELRQSYGRIPMAELCKRVDRNYLSVAKQASESGLTRGKRSDVETIEAASRRLGVSSGVIRKLLAAAGKREPGKRLWLRAEIDAVMTGRAP